MLDMDGFSVTKAAFAGFGLARRRPAAFLFWFAYLLVMSIFSWGISTLVFFPPDAAAMFQGAAGGASRTAMDLIQRYATGLLFLLGFGVLTYAILGSAVLRAMLKPDDDRFGYLRLGKDEALQIGLGFLTLIVFICVYFIFAVISGIGLQVLSALAPGPQLTVVVVPPLAFLVLAVFSIRFSLAPVHTFDSGSINLLTSWALTGRRLGQVVCTYLLIGSVVALMAAVAMPIIISIDGVLSGRDISHTILASNLAPAFDYYTSFRFLPTVLSAALFTIALPFLLAPAVEIYRYVIALDGEVED